MKQWIALVGVVVSLGAAGVAVGQGRLVSVGFFDAPPLYSVVTYGPEWRYRYLIADPSGTGRVIVVWEHVDTAGQPDGQVSFHSRQDTRFGKCLDRETGIPVGCAAGTVIAP